MKLYCTVNSAGHNKGEKKAEEKEEEGKEKFISFIYGAIITYNEGVIPSTTEVWDDICSGKHHRRHHHHQTERKTPTKTNKTTTNKQKTKQKRRRKKREGFLEQGNVIHSLIEVRGIVVQHYHKKCLCCFDEEAIWQQTFAELHCGTRHLRLRGRCNRAVPAPSGS